MSAVITDELDEYQRRAVDFVMEREGCALFMEQGTGKTHVTCGVIERLMLAHAETDVLLVVPLPNLESTWVRTLERMDVAVCRTWEDHKKARKTRRRRHRVLVLNYERVRPIIKRLKTVTWTFIAYDESQRLKGRGSKQSRDAARLTGLRRVVLSGTPIEQEPQDLWGQFRFAVPDVLGHRWAPFKERWLKETGYMGYQLKFRMEKLPRFLKLIAPHILRIRKEDVLDLPPLRYVRCPVDLLGDQARIYRELTDDMASTVGDEPVTCDMAITQLIRQQQVCGGFVRLDPTESERAQAAAEERDPEGRLVPVGRAKLRRLRAIVRREKRRPLIVFCGYREEIPSVVEVIERCGLTCGVVSGKTKRSRNETIRRFQRGELGALVCQIKAGGVGLDLQRACVSIFYSTT